MTSFSADDTPLHSRDFDSYESFREAREMREIDDAMDELRDFTCSRPFCKARMWCLWEDIDCLQDMFAREFFNNEVAPEEKLLSESDVRACRIKACDALPENWHDPDTFSHQALTWFIDLSGALFFHKNNRVIPLRTLRKVCNVNVDAVGRAVYSLTERVIHGKSWNKEVAVNAMNLIEGFLIDPRLFDRLIAGVLIERSRKLADAILE